MVDHDEPPTADMLRVLRENFKIPKFYPLQWKVISNTLKGHDQIGVFSTNFGKSLLYQFPAVYGRGIVIVVTPTISLMRDQVAAMQKLNIPACLLGSAQRHNDRVIADIERNYYKLVYVSPEFLLSLRGQILIQDIAHRISLLAVDEVHCVCEWKDFRPQFRYIGAVRQYYLPYVPILALTASATESNVSEIIIMLKMKFPTIIKSSLNRPNLYLKVMQKSGKGIAADMKAALNMQRTLKPTILFCAIKADADTVNGVLTGMGIKSAVYHSSRPEVSRAEVQDLFMKNQLQVVVATSSFGMGVNKKDVHCVIHYGPSWSLESYFQQIGRAGRDGHFSLCIVFYRYDDFCQPWVLHAKCHKLAEIYHYFGEHLQCRKRMLLRHFGEIEPLINSNGNRLCCDNCDRRAIDTF